MQKSYVSPVFTALGTVEQITGLFGTTRHSDVLRNGNAVILTGSGEFNGCVSINGAVILEGPDCTG